MNRFLTFQYLMATNEAIRKQLDRVNDNANKAAARYEKVDYFMRKVPLLKKIIHPVKERHKLLKTRFRLQQAKLEIQRLKEEITKYEKESRIN